MVYDLMHDAPSTLISNIPAKKEIRPPSPRFFDDSNMFYNTGVLSPIKQWWDEEVQKKREGLINEIDQGDIRAAMRGVINAWYPIIQKHPEHFLLLDIERGIWKWDIIIQIKRNFQK